MAVAINNNGRHLLHILQSTTCRKHKAEEGTPCFTIYTGTTSSNSVQLFGACGHRIKRAGFDGKISPTSMTLRTPGGSRGSSSRPVSTQHRNSLS